MSAPVALVTGAARGIGAACVRGLAGDGYRVVLVDAGLGANHGIAGVGYALASPEELEAVAAEVDGRALRCDVRDRGDLAEAVSDTVADLGRLDVVVAAAAVLGGGAPLWETPAAELEALLAVDAVGVVNTAAACVPHLLSAQDPARTRFVAVASAAAHRGLFHLGGYVVAKHAVVGVVRALVADLSGTGVVVAGVSPGATRTPMLSATATLYGVSEEELASHQEVPVVFEPEEVAAVVRHLCSPAGRALHGRVLPVDGGFRG